MPDTTPDTSREAISIPLDKVEEITRRCLTHHGAADDVATEVARAVRVAEGNHNRICGLYYLESYCLQLKSGRIDGHAKPVVNVDRPGAVRVDGRLGFAQPAFAAGFGAALSAARSNGICGMSVEHTHTCTSLGYFTEQFAREGLLAIGATNASPRVSPPGGSVPVLGTNPIAMAVPDGDGGIAFQFDFSTSAVALGKITMASAAGEEIPLGWALDSDGKPTTDPVAALAGSLVSAGGYKGYGISLMVELLAGAMTGCRLSADVPPLKTTDGEPHDLGQFYVVVDPNAYSGAGFYDRLAALGKSISSQPGARLPGSDRTLSDPVLVEGPLWARVLELADD
ncbi:MAG: Ldh family oxidoreductase [Actinomycetota bacterium]|nr:Ldh family oxidoreductase [Actinomycetota bacterium]